MRNKIFPPTQTKHRVRVTTSSSFTGPNPGTKQAMKLKIRASSYRTKLRIQSEATIENLNDVPDSLPRKTLVKTLYKRILMTSHSPKPRTPPSSPFFFSWCFVMSRCLNFSYQKRQTENQFEFLNAQSLICFFMF